MAKKRLFILKGVDYQAVNNKYGLVLMSNIETEFKGNSGAKTNISDVIQSEPKYAISFLDENKKEYNCVSTMVDLSSNGVLPTSTSICCFWCRHPFLSVPIGCPTKYVNSYVEKSYVSQITKDEYYIKENVTEKKLNKIVTTANTKKNINIIPTEKNYYITDGIFCSFNCVLAFINDNKTNIFYKESPHLLSHLYRDFTGNNLSIGSNGDKLIPAPHWRLLKNYGGFMDINEFRNSFNFANYNFIFNTVDMKTISKIFKRTM
jgi:hypothetical protein